MNLYWIDHPAMRRPLIDDVRPPVWPRWWVPDRIMIAVGLFAWSSLSVGAVLARMIRHATGGAVAIEFALCLSVAVGTAAACGTLIGPALSSYTTHLEASIAVGQQVLAALQAATP